MKLKTVIGHNISVRRKELGLTYQQLATKARTSKSYIWEIENSNIHPSIWTCKRIVDVLGISLDDLITVNKGKTDEQA